MSILFPDDDITISNGESFSVSWDASGSFGYLKDTTYLGISSGTVLDLYRYPAPHRNDDLWKCEGCGAVYRVGDTLECERCGMFITERSRFKLE